MSRKWSAEALMFQGSVQDMTNKPASKYTKTVQLFCKYCGNPQSFILNVKNPSKIRKEKYCKLVLHFIKKYQLDNFTTNDLMNIMQIEFPEIKNLSNGALQLKALSCLSVLGEIQRIRIEYKTKKGKTKFKWGFKVNQNPKIPICYSVENDRHKKLTNEEWEEREYSFNEKERADGDKEQ